MTCRVIQLSELPRPSLGTMLYGDHVKRVAHHRVGDQVGCSDDNELAGAFHATRASHVWHSRQATHHGQDRIENAICRRGIVLRDVAACLLETVERDLTPEDLHPVSSPRPRPT